MKNGVLIGGSPSTGSSVLVNILNRHPDLLAGPETYLFAHPSLFTDWAAKKRYLADRSKFGGLKSVAWFRKNGTDLLDPFYGWTQAELRAAVADSGSLSDFAAVFFARAMERKGASTWVEKSPTNAICLEVFLQRFPGGKAVHTVRDPYDAIGSLVARGQSPFYATGAYLINTAFALKAEQEREYYCLKYEDWASRPEKILPSFFAFLGLEWCPEVLKPEAGGEAVRMSGWLHDEKGPLQAGSVGRFQRLRLEQREPIQYAVDKLRINAAWQKKWGLPVSRITEVCEKLGYEKQAAPRSYYFGMSLARMRDRVVRLARLYPSGINYPL